MVGGAFRVADCNAPDVYNGIERGCRLEGS